MYELIQTQVYTQKCQKQMVWGANRCEQNTHTVPYLVAEDPVDSQTRLDWDGEVGIG